MGSCWPFLSVDCVWVGLLQAVHEGCVGLRAMRATLRLLPMAHAAMHSPCLTALSRRTMVTQLVEKERIRTTLPKALALRRVADKAVGLGKEVRRTPKA